MKYPFDKAKSGAVYEVTSYKISRNARREVLACYEAAEYLFAAAGPFHSLIGEKNTRSGVGKFRIIRKLEVSESHHIGSALIRFRDELLQSLRDYKIIGIEKIDIPSGSLIETLVTGRSLAAVALHPKDLQPGLKSFRFMKHLCRTVRAAVVHGYYLKVTEGLHEKAVQAFAEPGLHIIYGYHDRYRRFISFDTAYLSPRIRGDLPAVKIHGF